MPNPQHIIIVSGSPRSGTSLMMQILETGGVPLYYDDTKPPDQSNPYGYFEKHEMFYFSADPRYDSPFLSLCQNKGVKILPPTVLPTLVQNLNGRDCLVKIVFMLRDETEVANSYITMVEQAGKLDVPGSPFYGKTREQAMAQFIEMRRANIQSTLDFFNSPDNTADVLLVDHNNLMLNPLAAVTEVSQFIKSDLPDYEMNPDSMATIVDLELYRQRQSMQP